MTKELKTYRSKEKLQALANKIDRDQYYAPKELRVMLGYTNNAQAMEFVVNLCKDYITSKGRYVTVLVKWDQLIDGIMTKIDLMNKGIFTYTRAKYTGELEVRGSRSDVIVIDEGR